jgi:exopolysaccharide biosynthesis WecB/TagA/CpsF family protein
VVTPNANFFVKAEREAAVRSLYSSADLSVCDSRVVARLAMVAGYRIPVVTGSDLVRDIIESPRSRTLDICMIGGRDGYQQHITETYGLERFRQFQFPFQAHFTDGELDSFCAQLDGQHAITMICLGTPLQERLASVLRAKAGDRFPTILCVGASIDFLVGFERRAPAFVSAMGLEWLFRFCQKPRRLFRRYFIENASMGKMYLRWLVETRRARGRPDYADGAA